MAAAGEHLGADFAVLYLVDYDQISLVSIGSGPVQTHVLCAHYDHDRAVSTQ